MPDDNTVTNDDGEPDAEVFDDPPDHQPDDEVENTDSDEDASPGLFEQGNEAARERITQINDRLPEIAAELRDNLSEGARTAATPDYLTGVKAVVIAWALIPFMLLTPVLRALPGTWRVYHKLHSWSAWQMQKAASANAVANVRRSNGKEDVRPAKYVEGDEDDKERSGWKILGFDGKRYDPAVHGRNTSRFGKADVIHVNEDDTEQGTWAECAMDNAIQLNRERYLFRDAQVKIQNLVYDAPPAGGGRGGGDAVADGGEVQPNQRVQTQDVSVARPGVVEDAVVPLSSRAGYDGQVVSLVQYSNLKNSQSDQETIRDAKNQAWAAAKLDDINGTDIFKWVLILGAIGAILLFHQDIGAMISGLTNNGGGGGGPAPTGGLG